MKLPGKIFLILGTVAAALCTISYTSCKKDRSCPTGAGGKNCETVYRTTYANTDTGTGSCSDGNCYLDGFRLTFLVSGSDLTKMDVVTGTASQAAWNFTITLYNFTSTGASFTVVPFKYGNITYAGSGTISATGASLTLYEDVILFGKVYTFANFKKM